jgi:hypothetical protein
MTIPSDEVVVSLYFHGRPLEKWTREDRKVILHKLQDLMRVKGKKKPAARRSRHAKNGR